MTVSASDVKRRAGELGFDVCGIAPVADHAELGFLARWLALGYAGSMSYLARTADRRADVRHVLPSARSVIVTGTIYNTARPYSTESTDPARAQIARYAWGDDYHEIIGERLTQLLAWMRQSSSEPFDAKAYVDTGPVQERAYAQRAGVGWIGKNTCIIHPTLGSWMFLAEIICSLELDADEPSFDQCGTCSLCLEACPTQALTAPGVLDARRCISYLTIEHRGDIPTELGRRAGSWVFGCDVCQEVCPWNAAPPISTDVAWQPRQVWDGPLLTDLQRMSDEQLRPALKGSAMMRAQPSGLRRNIRIAGANAQAATAPEEDSR
jgi:epoxyqueuosine reductase